MYELLLKSFTYAFQHFPTGPFSNVSSIFISSEANKKPVYVVSESRGTEHKLILGLLDDGNDGSVCPTAFEEGKRISCDQLQPSNLIK